MKLHGGIITFREEKNEPDVKERNSKEKYFQWC